MPNLEFEPRLSGPGPRNLITVLCCAPFATKDKSKLAVEKRREIFHEINTNFI